MQIEIIGFGVIACQIQIVMKTCLTNKRLTRNCIRQIERAVAYVGVICPGAHIAAFQRTVIGNTYQYEYEKSLRVYSMTIDLEMIGRDQNFTEEADAEEKAERVNRLLSAVENLSLIVKGNLDNAEPIFVVGGFSDRKTHYFENVVKVIHNKLELSEDLLERVKNGFSAALLKGHNFDNEEEVVEQLGPVSIREFFDTLRRQVKEYYT